MRKFFIILIAIVNLLGNTVVGALECLPESEEELAHHTDLVPDTPDNDDENCCHGHCCHGALHYAGAITEFDLCGVKPVQHPEDQYQFASLTFTTVPLPFPP